MKCKSDATLRVIRYASVIKNFFLNIFKNGSLADESIVIRIGKKSPYVGKILPCHYVGIGEIFTRRSIKKYHMGY